MQRPRATVGIRHTWWHTVLIDTLKVEASNFAMNPSLHWKPALSKCRCTCMPDLKKNKSGCAVFHALKLIQFVMDTSQRNIQ